MKIVVVIMLILTCSLCCAQDPFPFGANLRPEELGMKVYPRDTAAVAVVLNEYGDGRIQDYGDEILLVFKYHGRIKILRPKGLDLANIAVPLYKNGDRIERLISVKASSFNIEDGRIREVKLNPREVFTENIDKNSDQKKFTIPNVRVGSVIEYEYELTTPFFFNFRTWNFQSDIPKLYSEYEATIPANWRYNIALRGLLSLKKNESKVLREYFSTPAGKSDCVRYTWGMENIPAFYEEEYMTSKYNFLSAVNFELLQIEHFDGRKDRITKEWKDVEQELRTAENFGLQLRRGKDIVDAAIESVIEQETDPRIKAEKIFDFIRHWYDWNDRTSKYTDIGIKKAFDLRKGNVGDINLSLIAALRYAGLDVEPMILSTRDNGLPVDLYPVLSDFNYVVAKVNINDQVYLLDATDDFLPFGLLPQRCLNGRGRVLGEKESYWYDIKAAQRDKVVSMIDLTLTSEGKLSGSIRNSYFGYRGAYKRSDVYQEGSVDAYLKKLKNEHSMEVVEGKVDNIDDLAKPLVEALVVNLEDLPFDQAKSFFFNPFLSGRWARNPFHLAERLFPVDFGAPLEETNIIRIDLPPNIGVTDLPPNTAIALPGNGGKYLFSAQVNGTKLVINSSLVINRPVYGSEEYPALKEFFNRVVKSQSTDLVFEKIVK